MEELNKFVNELNESQAKRFKELGHINECFFDGEELTQDYKYKILEKKKYIYINCGTSGVYMVVRETGEIFGIKAYGVINKSRFYGRLGETTGEDAYKKQKGVYY